MRRLVVLLLVLAGQLRSAGADVASADLLFVRGDYTGAIKDYKAVTGTQAPAAQVRIARVLFHTGDLAAARTMVESTKTSDAVVLLAEIHRASGRYAEARKLLEDIATREPKHLRARWQLGLVYDETGESALADKIWNRFFDELVPILDKLSPDEMMYLAAAARHRKDFKSANELLQDAVGLQAKLHEANVMLGNLYLEKYNVADAASTFRAVLKIDPGHPDALAGMARVAAQGRDHQAAFELVTKTLVRHPNHPQTLLVKADLEIDNNEGGAGEQTLGRILAVNPNHVEARARLAGLRWLADDKHGYAAEKAKVFATNRSYTGFFHIIFELGTRWHRYREAIALAEEALRLDPKDAMAAADLALGYFRLGDEPKGLEHLAKAFARDRFNARVYNMLELYDRTIPKKYEWVSPSKTFRFRFATAERKILERYIPRALDGAFADMVKRYGFTPKRPVTFEIYADRDHFSVRTEGLPNLGARGVCFGEVVTAVSPSNPDHPWGLVVWHELGHVFALQLSRQRVPRWFTEGLADYEATLAQRGWSREHDVDLFLALSTNTLPSVNALDTQFLRADGLAQTVVAYHMSYATIRFIIETWGFPKIVEALKLYGAGKATDEVILAIARLSVADFDLAFRAHLGKRLAAYAGSFHVSEPGEMAIPTFQRAIAAAPRDAGAQANLALAYIGARKPDLATPVVAAALALEPKHTTVLYAAAKLAVYTKAAGAKDAVDALIASGGDGYGAQVLLGRLAIRDGDMAKAERHLLRARSMEPERDEPAMLLDEVYATTNRTANSMKEHETYVYLDELGYAATKRLVDRYATAKMWTKVTELGTRALFMNPFDASLHLTLGEAYVKVGAIAPAIYEYESALLSSPALSRPALAHIGLAHAYLAKRDRVAATKAVDVALALEPQNVEALELAKRVAGKR